MHILYQKDLDKLKTFECENKVYNFLTDKIQFDYLSIYSSAGKDVLNIVDDQENQKKFKVAEDILEYIIEKNYLKVVKLIDIYIYYFFYSVENKDYLFNSKNIYYCDFTYREIIDSDEEYIEKHKKRDIDPNFYSTRCLKWVYNNLDLIKNISF